MAPRGLGIRSGERLPAVKGKRDHPASPRSLSANWITEVLDLLDPTPAAEGPGCSGPVPCDSAGRFRARAMLFPTLAAQAAFRQATPLDRIAPAPLNIATALHAEAMGGVCAESGGVGMDGDRSRIADSRKYL